MDQFSTRFLNIMPWLIKWEGSTYENDKDDPGGATKFGIDQASHPNEDIRNLTKERAMAIYNHTYWNGGTDTQGKLIAVCETLATGLGEVHFNARVNTGKGRAAKFLAASNSASEYLDEMNAFYKRLADGRPKSRKYLKGWLNRTDDLRKFLGVS